MNNKLKVLELYSGIGGMHFALQESGLSAEIIAAADINTVANTVYRHNFPKTSLIEKNIQSFTKEFINSLDIDMILMSPPCQPFTRVGNKKDISDNRCVSSVHITDLLPSICGSYILLENVRGFETSKLRDRLLESLHKSDYSCVEFILSPLQFGVPNSRERYYLLAKRKPSNFSVHSDQLITSPTLLTTENETYRIRKILEFDDDSPRYDTYLVPENVLETKIFVMDIVTKDSERSCCFTKSYGRYLLGTGSVYCPCDDDPHLKSILDRAKSVTPQDSKEWLTKLLDLRIRFFTPREVARLMGFPDNFRFPAEVNDKQKYKLLGNSLNVVVVSKLIQFLMKQ